MSRWCCSLLRSNWWLGSVHRHVLNSSKIKVGLLSGALQLGGIKMMVSGLERVSPGRSGLCRMDLSSSTGSCWRGMCGAPSTMLLSYEPKSVAMIWAPKCPLAIALRRIRPMWLCRAFNVHTLHRRMGTSPCNVPNQLHLPSGIWCKWSCF